VEDAKSFRRRLRRFGFANPAIDAAWPAWWSDNSESSTDSQSALRLSVAAKLGLTPESILDDAAEPRFVWGDEACFKRVTVANAVERAGIVSFGRSVARLLLRCMEPVEVRYCSALELRQAVLKKRPFVALTDLLAIAWSVGVPVVHLRVFPWAQKKMAAMTVREGSQCVILLGKDSCYPATIAFFLAHEIGHVMLGHLNLHSALIDMDDDAGNDTQRAVEVPDAEELAADTYALALLTGSPDLSVLPRPGSSASGPSLAAAALRSGPELGLEPGTLALCYGHTTGRWDIANSALNFIYSHAKPVWAEVNAVALSSMNFNMLDEDSRTFARAVLGDGA
jgi:hypothetical protein